MLFQKCLKKLFLNPFNLVLYGAGLAAAGILGSLGLASMVTAIELTWIVVVASNTRYQRAIGAEINAINKAEAKAAGAKRYREMRETLPWEDRGRFDNLAGKCESLQDKGTNTTTDVDKLLWAYMQILSAKAALAKFVGSVDESEIDKEIDKTKVRLGTVTGSAGSGGSAVRKAAVLQDILDTAIKRKDNLNNARSNIEILDLKLEQTESKLNMLAETAINSHDPDAISAEISLIASSVEINEQHAAEIRSIAGYVMEPEAPPILSFGIEPSNGRQDRFERIH